MAPGGKRTDWPQRVDAVLLDAGGVLLDLDYAYLRRLIEVRHGKVTEEELSRLEAVARQEIHRQVADGGRVSEAWRDYFHIILAKVGVPPEDQGEIIDALWEAHQRFGLWTVAIPGSRETVADLKRRGYRLGVVSNAEGRVEQDLETAGYKDFFETVVDSHCVGVEKPDPGIFDIALERMTVVAANAVFLGDVPSVDIDGALAAGLTPILLDRHDLYPQIAERRLRSIRDLTDLLEDPDGDA